jgi:predicted MFS family arabinose efflux permease
MEAAGVARPGFLAVFIAMLATQVLVAMAGLAAPVLAPIAARDFGLHAHLVGIFVSILYGGAATIGLISGPLIARLGAVRVSQLCLLLSAAALALTTISSPWALVLGALVLGLGYGPATPASSHLLAKVTPPHRLNLVFSLKQTGVPLGNALAGAVLPGAALAFGWRAAVLAGALACLVTALLLQPLRAALDADTRPVSVLAALRRPFEPLFSVLSMPALRVLALTSFAFAGMQVCVGAFLVTYLVEGVELSPINAGFLLSCAQAAGVGGRILWGAAADALKRPTLVLGGLGLAMSLAAIMVGLFTPSWPYLALVAVAILFGGTAIAWNGIHLAQLARLAPAGRAAELTGGAFFVTFGGVTVVPLIFSFLLSATDSYALAFASVAALTLASGFTFLTRRLRPEPSTQEPRFT